MMMMFVFVVYKITWSTWPNELIVFIQGTSCQECTLFNVNSVGGRRSAVIIFGTGFVNGFWGLSALKFGLKGFVCSASGMCDVSV